MNVNNLCFHRRSSEFIGGRGFEYYLYTGAAEHDAEYIGRFDSLQFAVEHITQDPVTFLFGYGAANVAESFLHSFPTLA